MEPWGQGLHGLTQEARALGRQAILGTRHSFCFQKKTTCFLVLWPSEHTYFDGELFNYQLWSPEVKAYMDSLKKPELWDGKPYSVRSSASVFKTQQHVFWILWYNEHVYFDDKPSNYQLWSPEVKAYMDSLKKPELWDGKPYSVRGIRFVFKIKQHTFWILWSR